MGDMNYRVDLNDAAVNRGEEDPKISKEDMWKMVTEMEAKGDFESICMADELGVSIETW